MTTKTSLYDDPNPPTRVKLERNQYYADVAASLQKVLEETMIKLAFFLQAEGERCRQ